MSQMPAQKSFSLPQQTQDTQRKVNPSESQVPLRDNQQNRFEMSDISLNIPGEIPQDGSDNHNASTFNLPYRTEGNSPKGGKLTPREIPTYTNGNVLDDDSEIKNNKEEEYDLSFQREMHIPPIENSQDKKYEVVSNQKNEDGPTSTGEMTPIQRLQWAVRQVIKQKRLSRKSTLLRRRTTNGSSPMRSTAARTLFKDAIIDVVDGMR